MVNIVSGITSFINALCACISLIHVNCSIVVHEQRNVWLSLVHCNLSRSSWIHAVYNCLWKFYFVLLNSSFNQSWYGIDNGGILNELLPVLPDWPETDNIKKLSLDQEYSFFAIWCKGRAPPLPPTPPRVRSHYANSVNCHREHDVFCRWTQQCGCQEVGPWGMVSWLKGIPGTCVVLQLHGLSGSTSARTVRTDKEDEPRGKLSHC